MYASLFLPYVVDADFIGGLPCASKTVLLIWAHTTRAMWATEDVGPMESSRNQKLPARNGGRLGWRKTDKGWN